MKVKIGKNNINNITDIDTIQRNLRWTQITYIPPTYIAVSKSYIHLLYLDKNTNQYVWELYKKEYLQMLFSKQENTPVEYIEETNRSSVIDAVKYIENRIPKEELNIPKEEQEKFYSYLRKPKGSAM